MQIGTFNVRGLGGTSKQNKIKNMVYSEKLDFMLIQETKMTGIEERLCNKLWGISEF